jgi:hypothetical protein
MGVRFDTGHGVSYDCLELADKRRADQRRIDAAIVLGREWQSDAAEHDTCRCAQFRSLLDEPLKSPATRSGQDTNPISSMRSAAAIAQAGPACAA